MIELTTDSADVLKALSKALAAEADGKKLKRDLAKEIRKAAEPAVSEAKGRIMGMRSAGLPKSGPPLRTAIAREVKAEARLSGFTAGARVKAKKRKMPRGFDNAPKRTNRAAGWRHPLWGRGEYVHQVGRPDWFDDSMANNAQKYRAAVLAAMEDAARRIAQRAR